VKQSIICSFLICVMLCSFITGLSTSSNIAPLDDRLSPEDRELTAADSGAQFRAVSYVVVELRGGDIPARGNEWAELLRSRGIPTNLLQIDEILTDASLIGDASAILLDGSLASSSGDLVPQTLIDLLVQTDTSLILTGRSAWLLHRLTSRNPPSLTAPAETILYSQPEYSGAVFLTSPFSLSIGQSLTTEGSISLPMDTIQTAMSRLVNLTASSSPAKVPPLRYDSWPLDIFLFAPEDPFFLTLSGQYLLVNALAYCTALRECTTASILSGLQSQEGSLLAGGLSYAHEPTIASTYYAVHIMDSLLTGSLWTDWVSANAPLVQTILSSLLVDNVSESGIMTSRSEGIVDCRSTAQGLWVINRMRLTSQFPTSELVAYLSSRQSPDGGFENYVTTTYHVTEALWSCGQLSSIDIGKLEQWLRFLVIDGSKTSDPDLWGAIGLSPTSISPLNSYAVEYLRSLAFLGKAHPDPVKLTNWIISRTSNGDGSYRNSLGLDEEVVTGTASALETMQLLGTLSAANKSSGLDWLANNQLASGGFGLKAAVSDLAGKTRETSRVAACLKALSESSGSLASGVISYVDSITTSVGFEVMDSLPSLMWTSWLLDTARLVHASQSVNLSSARNYISCFNKFSIYPFWANLTTATAPEYSTNQYRTKSVWTQYFGVSAAAVLGIDLNPNVISDVVQYLSQSQSLTGHYRQTSLMGNVHMQYSVAAVETLFLLGELDTIPSLSNLETAILSEYNGGSWSMAGWTLSPFADSPEAIDFLSTRAALRLGLVTPAMAAEIATTIESHLDYSDLLALSWDAATLSLLQTSAFSVDLESIDSSQVFSALRSSHFIDGWFNSSVLWQPIYTSSVLRMVSILGLRCLLYSTAGAIISASSNATVQIGDTLDISVSITSGAETHRVFVSAFNESWLFTNVGNDEALRVSIPEAGDSLGPWNVSLILMDWGVSRDFDLIEVVVQGTLEGLLTLHTPIVKMGESINGTANWALSGGSDAGLAHVTIDLGEPPSDYQWSYDTSSVVLFSIPTNGLDAGSYPLTLTVAVPFCPPLVRTDEVLIAVPNPTYLTSMPETSALVEEELRIDWSLHYVQNDSKIANQVVMLTITDSTDQIVFTDTLMSAVGGNTFHWTPSIRGDFSFLLSFDGNRTLEGSQVEGIIHVYQLTTLTWLGADTIDQYSKATLSVLLETVQGQAISWQSVHVIVTAPSSVTVVDAWFTTNVTGQVSITFTLAQNGVYLLQAQYPADAFLQASSATDSLISWSTSLLELSGIQSEVTVGETCRLSAHLEDLLSNPISGQQVVLRVVLLPSTVLVEQALTTNSSGFATLQWTFGSAGSYRFEATYSGTISRSSANEHIDFNAFIPLTLVLNTSVSSVAGLNELIEIRALNHLSNPVSGISISITIRGPEGMILYTNTSSTIGGAVVFSWSPSKRGINEITVVSVQQGVYEAASSAATIDVYEVPDITVDVPGETSAPSTVTINVSLSDYGASPIDGVVVHVEVILNAAILIDSNFTTDSSGCVSVGTSLATPGSLQVEILVFSQGWLLEASAAKTVTVMATTALVVTTPGQPVEQGSTVGIVISLDDFSGAPLIGASVQINIAWSNGSLIKSMTRTTDNAGQCTIAQTFNFVGDFVIKAIYEGYGLNASSTHSVPQRVFLVPCIDIAHDPSCITGESMQFIVNLTDIFGNFIVGRPLELTIEQRGMVVFEVQFQSDSLPSIITWNPAQGGLATVTVTHSGSIYYLSVSKVTTVSIMELVSGSLTVSPGEIDLFQSTMLCYYLQTSVPRDGIIIHFEVLGMDLVPVWSTDVLTNSSGIAEIVYTASEAYGVLHVNAGPEADEFLIGGEVQEQLVVKTYAHVTVTLQPSPSRVNTLTNITIHVLDDLGGNIDGPTVTVSLYNPYGEIVKLGTWTSSVTVAIEDGLAFVESTPTMVGLYTVVLSSSGSISVCGFTGTTHHTIYSTTQLRVNVSTYELEVGQTLGILARLLDYNSLPLVNRNIVLLLDSPGASSYGPVALSTNSTGYVMWSVIIDDEGFWTVEASFGGLGVYLPVSASANINVKYGTVIDLSLETLSDIIAGQTETNFSILLTDTGGTPLEGFTVHYEVHHTTSGMVTQGNLVQIDTNSIILSLPFSRMGEYTILVSFSGTSHYHASNAALQFAVLGTTAVFSGLPESIDRSSERVPQFAIVDEVSEPIPLTELEVTINLHRPGGMVDLAGRLLWNQSWIGLRTYGLANGDYTLSIDIGASDLRLGCASQIQFKITSITHFTISSEDLSGLISEPHSITFLLIDSLNDTVDSADVWVSLYDPLGREIYGHPLTTRTPLQSSLTGAMVSWTPTLVGEYRTLLVFEGDDFLNATSLEINVLVLHESTLSADAPTQSEFGEIVPVSITLQGALGGITAASVNIVVLMSGEIEQKVSLVTGSRGIVSTNLVGLLAGAHTIAITFLGSTTQAACSINLTLEVSPVVVCDLEPVGTLYASNNCSIELTVSVLGTELSWKGSLEATLFNPAGLKLLSWDLTIDAYSLLYFDFIPLSIGNYMLNVSITGLPVTTERIYPLEIVVVDKTLVLPLDAETTPMFGGIGILAIIGFVMRRKMRGMLESIASEWQE
jgi:prenyltransferase beta subunit